MSDETRLREAICETGRSLHARGYVHSSAGNISARLDDGFLITPTDACLGQLDPAGLAHVGAHGQQSSGLPASKTLQLHRAIYESNEAARCVLHTHSTHLVALTLRGVWHPDCVLPPLTPYMVMKVGEIPLIPYHLPGAPAVARLIQQKMQTQTGIRGVLIERLGPMVWSATPQGASNVLEEFEETARLWLMSAGSTAPLTTEQVRALCDRFGVEWNRMSAKD
ncbi:aldolase [Hydrogenophaga crassostreae]|uniref:Aldolase n=1 Tax=Hydrogenophaga crassostreae TaxID=1763535 RepID=A0A162W129_9BURK|nr:aldolase [Hydrogenophaga crassostreae]AOW14192.1 aldolase [Hydrogenophaga crassostreae]OAD42878.1 aldolase [Hydrogenophaga crassostreae]